MNLKNLMVALVVTMACVSSSFAGESGDNESTTANSSFIGQLQLSYKLSRDKNVQRSLFAKQLYLEKEIGNDVSVFGLIIHDQEFQSGYIGLSKKLGDFYLGLGIGPARYDGVTRLAFNPWLFYSAKDFEGLLSVEHYRKERDEPWYYKGYAYKKFRSSFAGIYTEKDVGIGPMVGTYVAQKAKIWVAVPTANKPTTGGMKAIVGITIDFD